MKRSACAGLDRVRDGVLLGLLLCAGVAHAAPPRESPQPLVNKASTATVPLAGLATLRLDSLRFLAGLDTALAPLRRLDLKHCKLAAQPPVQEKLEQSVKEGSDP